MNSKFITEPTSQILLLEVTFHFILLIYHTGMNPDFKSVKVKNQKSKTKKEIITTYH